jgi:hypothetical protein
LPVVLFELNILEIGWAVVFLFYAFHHTGMRAMCHYAQLSSVEMGSRKAFCPGWPGTMIFLILAFQLPRIPGVSHLCLASSFFFLLPGSRSNQLLYMHITFTC